jgi:hypothetical protein
MIFLLSLPIELPAYFCNLHSSYIFTLRSLYLSSHENIQAFNQFAFSGCNSSKNKFGIELIAVIHTKAKT